ncbi:HAMP domain-containing protein [Halomonas eurihalina]|uniref:histidine kinase n=1 Tax=Halomonas eurihalina TaxID=42566 RepID=A0A5D9DAX3_HALER|nr:ATP-binding protein [Halomonas eurihalina]MDR5859121.1 ATP-binding protein [Halomonas eurihalina]TZG41048.1 HAMP domain-containing protein [Halomonas eurihalina]
MPLLRLLPRALVDSTFLRVYVLLALALVLALGLSLSAISLVDKVRREQYHERLADVPMTLLVQRLSALPKADQAGWLASHGERLAVDLTLHESRDDSLGYFERLRLSEGHTLVSRARNGHWQLYRRLPGEARLLRAELGDVSEAQLRGLVRVLGEWLQPLPSAVRQRWLERLSNPAVPLAIDDGPPKERRETAGRDVVARSHPAEGALSLYWPLSGGQVSGDVPEAKWLTVGPLQPYRPPSVPVLSLVVVMVLSILAVIIYLIVRGVESRMTRLEQAATRIAGGRLDTRVKVQSGDFLGRLGMAFNGMAEQVQSLLRAQQDMTRAVSHELRTPVARIRFAVQMVEDMTDDPAVRHQLRGVDGDIAELDALVDEILTYARLDSCAANEGGLETEPVEGGALAERVITSVSDLHGHLDIDLVAGPEVEFTADPRYLQRALQNLVTNACRHATSRVRVSVEGEPGVVRFDVEDDGPGVPERARREIFKPFARLDDSRDRRSGGYGLGLSIVQKVMVWHGGSVMVDTGPALGGARFTLLLPRQEIAPVREA